MSYRRAKALNKLVEQVNKLYPQRDKKSDGWIGDAAHESRASDHNPWVKVREGGKLAGVVTAQDIDRDLSHEVKVARIVDALVAHRDPRIKYIIWMSRMISSYPAYGYDAWQWRPYSGSNKHTEHVHISLKSEKRLFDSEKEWNLKVNSTTEPQEPPAPHGGDYYIVQRGDSLSKIAKSFNTTVKELTKLNGLQNQNLIRVGQQLKVR